jgi:hypothetical protein
MNTDDIDPDFADALDEHSDTENLLAELSDAFDGVETEDEGASETVAKDDTKPDTRSAAERARDEKGRFAREAQEAADKAAGKTTAQPSTAQAPEAGAGEAPADAAASAAEVQPPTSWSPTAKAAFGTLPPEVQQAVAKREQEVNAGFAQLREYKDLKPFADLAKQKGDSLGGYLQRLVQAEHVLETNPVEGLKWLAGNLRVTREQLAQAFGIAPQQAQPQQAQIPQFVPPQPPEGVDPRRQDWQQHVQALYQRHMAYYQSQAAQRQQAPVRDPRVDEVARELAELKRMRQIEEARRAEEARKPLEDEVTKFMGNTKEYPYAQNLRDDMAILLEAGKAVDLKDAYEMAAWANPETRALLIKQQREEAVKPLTDRSRTAVSKARAASRSVTGAPLPGASNASAAVDRSIEDELRANWG